MENKDENSISQWLVLDQNLGSFLNILYGLYPSYYSVSEKDGLIKYIKAELKRKEREKKLKRIMGNE